MSEVRLWLGLPVVGTFVLAYLGLVILGRFDEGVCGPQRRASRLSQGLYSKNHAVQVMAVVVVLVSMSVVVAYRCARVFATTPQPVAHLAYALAAFVWLVFMGSCLRLRDFPSNRVRIATAGYFALLLGLFLVPELLQVCSHHGCWYAPFER
jgi:hypothetical protein